MEALDMALEYPDLFNQIWYDLTHAAPKTDGEPSWKKPGETAAQARDRLRTEREATKMRLAKAA